MLITQLFRFRSLLRFVNARLFNCALRITNAATAMDANDSTNLGAGMAVADAIATNAALIIKHSPVTTGPAVAYRHYHAIGTLRTFDVLLWTSESIGQRSSECRRAFR